MDSIDQHFDGATSGRTDNRPAFPRMIADSFQHGFLQVLVWSLTALSGAEPMPSPTQGDTRVRPLSIGEDVGDDGLAIVMDGILISGRSSIHAAYSRRARPRPGKIAPTRWKRRSRASSLKAAKTALPSLESQINELDEAINEEKAIHSYSHWTMSMMPWPTIP